MSKYYIYEGLYPTSTVKYNVTDDGQIYEGLYPTGNPIANIKDNIIYEGYYQSNPIGCIKDGMVYGGFYPAGNAIYNFNERNVYDNFYASSPRYCIREETSMYDECEKREANNTSGYNYADEDAVLAYLYESGGGGFDDMIAGASSLFQELF